MRRALWLEVARASVTERIVKEERRDLHRVIHSGQSGASPELNTSRCSAVQGSSAEQNVQRTR